MCKVSLLLGSLVMARGIEVVTLYHVFCIVHVNLHHVISKRDPMDLGMGHPGMLLGRGVADNLQPGMCRISVNRMSPVLWACSKTSVGSNVHIQHPGGVTGDWAFYLQDGLPAYMCGGLSSLSHLSWYSRKPQWLPYATAFLVHQDTEGILRWRRTPVPH